MNYDRHGNELKVGDIVTFAYNDELHGGSLVYIAEAKTAELVVEPEKYGLPVREGTAGSDGDVHYDDVLARE